MALKKRPRLGNREPGTGNRKTHHKPADFTNLESRASVYIRVRPPDGIKKVCKDRADDAVASARLEDEDNEKGGTRWETKAAKRIRTRVRNRRKVNRNKRQKRS